MKRFRRLMLVPAVIVCLHTFAGPLAADDREARPIYLPADLLAEAEFPSVSLREGAGALWMPGPEQFCGWALRDLSEYLAIIHGTPHPFSAGDSQAQRGMFVGTFEQFPNFISQVPDSEAVLAATDPEAFLIETQGERLFVLGKSRAGVIAAVYTLLDGLGCKWFAPGEDWESVPETIVPLDAPLNVFSTGPSYQARYFFSSYGPNSSIFREGQREEEYALWCLRNRMGGTAYVANYHNDWAMVPQQLFDTRPELFALAGGRRNSYGLSRANPETVALAVESAVRYLQENEGRGSYYDSFSVETNDGSPACDESLQKIGNHTSTDLNYWFANQVAAGIEQAGLENKWVGMCSYSDHAGIPSFDLHPRVAVVVTTGLDFSSGGLTVEQRLEGLQQRGCQRLGVYDYLNLITWSADKPGCSPATEPLVVGENLKRWHAYGATSYLAETSDSWVSGGAGHYLAARLLWDIHADPHKELDTYYAGAFGPAAGEVRALAEDWAALPMKVEMPPGALPGLPRISRERCARWHRWITDAVEKAQGDPIYLARINDLKRYYLYLNLTREYELDLVDPRLPSKGDRYLRLLRYVGANCGEGVFHARGLFVTLFVTLLSAAPTAGLDISDWPPEFSALATNINDEQAWQHFPPLSDLEIDAMFAAAELPIDGPAGPGTFDPRLRLFPIEARPPEELRFPKLHGPPAVARQYVLIVTAPTPQLTLNVVAGSPHGGGIAERTCVVTDSLGNEIQRFEYHVDQPASLELTDVEPGVYTATFPEFGAEQVTVTGGNTFGAVRVIADTWGYNPMRRSDQQDGDPVISYFVVPSGRSSLTVRLTDGAVSLGFDAGEVIAPELSGAATGQPQEFQFAAADSPRIAYVEVLRGQPSTIGLVIEGVTLFSPNPLMVPYETLE